MNSSLGKPFTRVGILNQDQSAFQDNVTDLTDPSYTSRDERNSARGDIKLEK